MVGVLATAQPAHSNLRGGTHGKHNVSPFPGVLRSSNVARLHPHRSDERPRGQAHGGGGGGVSMDQGTDTFLWALGYPNLLDNHF